MNIAKLNKLIDYLRLVPEKRFDVRYYFDAITPENEISYLKFKNDCGTSACIAGHYFIMEHPDHEILTYDDNPHGFAYTDLGLGAVAANELFTPTSKTDDMDTGDYRESITLPHAIRCLEKLRDTGRVDWEGTRFE